MKGSFRDEACEEAVVHPVALRLRRMEPEGRSLRTRHSAPRETTSITDGNRFRRRTNADERPPPERPAT